MNRAAKTRYSKSTFAEADQNRITAVERVILQCSAIMSGDFSFYNAGLASLCANSKVPDFARNTVVQTRETGESIPGAYALG